MPNPHDLAVLAVYFNPCGYRSTVANFIRFHEGMVRQGVFLQATELAFGDGPFYLPELPGVARMRTRDVLWQKERIFNHQIARLPRQYTKVVWIDADLLFDNDQWYDETRRALDHYPVVQPYQTGVWLNQAGEEVHRVLGIASAVHLEPTARSHTAAYHPGFAWAARRELVEKHGLYDRCILGDNDAVFTWGVYGVAWTGVMSRLPPCLRQDVEEWAKRVSADVQGNAGYVEGSVRHLWHGNLVYRQYLSRNQILVDAGFDLHRDIKIGEDGAWRWASEKPGLHESVRQFFVNRREDGDHGASSRSIRSATSSTDRFGS